LIRNRCYQHIPSAYSAGYFQESGFIYHLCGYGHPLIDGQKLERMKNLICIGTYKYAGATVQSFTVWLGQPKPLTKEQFAEVISSGFELVNYVEQGGKTIKVPIR